MKSRSIRALGAASFATAAAAFATGTASAQVLGLTATTRLQSDGNYLVNVWVVVGSSTNALTSSNTPIPAPGAFALVGIARLAGGRRRTA
jgi:MYXO-CTERM domain-containing protein